MSKIEKVQVEHSGFIQVKMTKAEFAKCIRAPLSYEDDLALVGTYPQSAIFSSYGTDQVTITFFPKDRTHVEVKTS